MTSQWKGIRKKKTHRKIRGCSDGILHDRYLHHENAFSYHQQPKDSHIYCTSVLGGRFHGEKDDHEL